MTMASRGISPIQKKARGNKSEKTSMKISKRKASPAAMAAGPMGGMGMKKGGSCAPKMAAGGSCKGYFKGGSVDGVIKKGRTKGKIC
jgi:hypothetical protein